MRPGFYTRKSGALADVALFVSLASMRPGFYTRKSAALVKRAIDMPIGFNEAGILHPEKPRSLARPDQSSAPLQ